MSVQEVAGKPQLVAAYTCSPVVLVPLEQIEDGAKIAASTIVDMGNGQPLDMVPFELRGKPMLFVTRACTVTRTEARKWRGAKEKESKGSRDSVTLTDA